MPFSLETSYDLPLTSKKDLMGYFEKHPSHPSSFSIGLEHEKFIFHKETLQRIPYEGSGGIKSFFEDLSKTGWTPILEGSNPIGLRCGSTFLTLEPGGQLEFSSPPLSTIHDLRAHHQHYLSQILPLAQKKGYILLGLGFDPLSTFSEIPWVPKERYHIMRDHMPHTGTLGLDMMTRTASFQISVDYDSEKDMCRKLRVGLALQPVIVALFSSSILKERHLTNFQSYRAHVWQDTDQNRTGGLDFAFEDTMGFERYVDYLLDVPLYFVYREGHPIPLENKTFRDFMEGRMPKFSHVYPTLKDWEIHVGTVFPDVRLKQYLEMRGADSGPLPFAYALAAFWKGLLYDATSLEKISSIVESFSAQERIFLRKEAPKTGLHTPFRGKTLTDLGETCLLLSREGLERQDTQVPLPEKETLFLKVLEDVCRDKMSLSDKISQAWSSFSCLQDQDQYIRSLAYAL